MLAKLDRAGPKVQDGQQVMLFFLARVRTPPTCSDIHDNVFSRD